MVTVSLSSNLPSTLSSIWSSCLISKPVIHLIPSCLPSTSLLWYLSVLSVIFPLPCHLTDPPVCFQSSSTWSCLPVCLSSTLSPIDPPIWSQSLSPWHTSFPPFYPLSPPLPSSACHSCIIFVAYPICLPTWSACLPDLPAYLICLPTWLLA